MAYLYPLVVVWVVFRVLGLLIPQRCGDRAVGSGEFCPTRVIIAFALH
jgi:hypothetical protein